MDANVRLSAEEMRLVTDPEWILTKNSIIRKVVEMFGELSAEWRVKLEGIIPSQPKISKGENYRGLPWVMLDCPRAFGREDVLAIRTFFWWGHAFSVTLHLKGIYQQDCLPGILAREAELAEAGFELGISATEWDHGHIPEHYRPWTDATELGADRPWLKLSAQRPLQDWEEAPERLSGLFGLLLQVISFADKR